MEGVEAWASGAGPSVSGSGEDLFADFFLAGFDSSFLACSVFATVGVGGDLEISSASSLVCLLLEAPPSNFVSAASFCRFSASFLTSASSFLSMASLPQTYAHFSKSTALTPSPNLSLRALTPSQSMPYSFLSYLIFRFHPPSASSQHTQRKSSSEKKGALSPSRIESNRLAVAGPTPFNSSSFFKGAVWFAESDLYSAKADLVVDSTNSSEFWAMSPGSEGRLVPCILMIFSISNFTIFGGPWTRGEFGQGIAQLPIHCPSQIFLGHVGTVWHPGQFLIALLVQMYELAQYAACLLFLLCIEHHQVHQHGVVERERRLQLWESDRGSIGKRTGSCHCGA